jgi:histone arginine demethylase JMJD6
MATVGKKRTWERRMDDAKAKHRPKLKDWSNDRFATTRKPAYDALFTLDLSKLPTSRPITRVDAAVTTTAEFIRKIESKYIPCVIDNTTNDWAAGTTWTFRSLKKMLGNRMFKVGEDDDGYKIKRKLKYFLKYMELNTDDSPLYVFDGSFDEDSVSKVRPSCVSASVVVVW